MKIFTVGRHSFNRVRAGKVDYFAFDRNGRYALLPSQCPHRGGPLHLGVASACKAKVVCPWHDNAYAVARLEPKGLPVIRTGDTVSFVTHEDEALLWNEFLPGALNGPDSRDSSS